MKSVTLLLLAPALAVAQIANPVLSSYIINTPDSSDALRRNLGMAIDIQQARQQAYAAQQDAQLRAIQLQQAQTEQENREIARRNMAELAEKGPTASEASLLELMTKFPEYSDAIRPYYEAAKARESVKQASRETSREADAACALGEAALEDKDFEGARKAATRALSLRQGWRELRLGGMVLLQQKKTAQARLFLEGAFRANGGDILTGGDLALAYLACGMRDKARETAAAVLKIQPVNDVQKAFVQRVAVIVANCPDAAQAANNPTKATPAMIRRARAYIARPDADPARVELIKARFRALGVEI